MQPFKPLTNPITKNDWFQYFTSVISPNGDHYHTGDIPIDSSYENDPILDRDVTACEIRSKINKMKNNKSPGCGLIPNELWKLASPTVLLMLCSIFQNCLNSGTVPYDWGLAQITPILKKGDPCSPKNYRPIALLNTILKLFTTILVDRLTIWLETNNNISEYQAGFRKGMSCQDHIFTLTSLLQTQLLKGDELFCCFIDLKQAFDTPDHGKLWEVLREFGISRKFIRVFTYLYRYVSASIKCNEGLTNPIKIMKGVLQGESASPSLFNIFIDGLTDDLNNTPLLSGIRLKTRIIHILLYAADIVLMADTKVSLQLKIDITRRFFNKRGLNVNLSKTKILVFRKVGHIRLNDKLFWGQEEIESVKSYLYLGVTFSSNGSFNEATKTAIRKGLAAQGATFQVLAKPKSMDIVRLCRDVAMNPAFKK